MHPHGIRVEVLGETARTEHGDTTTALVGAIEGCAFAPGTSSEDNDHRAQVVTSGALYVPPTTVPVTPQSQIKFPDGGIWRIEGDLQWWRNPFTGWFPGGVLQLRRVKG